MQDKEHQSLRLKSSETEWVRDFEELNRPESLKLLGIAEKYTDFSINII